MTDYSSIRVLIVDEDPESRERLSSFLRDYGFETAACESAKEARDLMIAEPFDVCVTELDLPGLSGEDLILLAGKRFPSQRYIIHTNHISYTLPAELQAVGMRPEHVFHKPVRVLNLLVKCIKELVESRGALRPAAGNRDEN